LFLITKVFSQDKLDLKLIIPNNESLPKKIKLPNRVKNQEDAIVVLEECLIELRKNSYVTSSVDSIFCDNISCNAYVFIGEKFQIKSLKNGNVDKEIWHKLGLKKIEKKYTVNDISTIENKILSQYENKGYPFAKVFLDSFIIENKSVSGKIFVEENDFIKIDSVVIHGDTKSKTKFIQRYIGIQQGDAYNQQLLNTIDTKLQQLSYLTESQPAEVYFKPGSADLHVYLKKQKSNQFNLIIGVLPNTGVGDSKVTVTGEGTLHLLNSFGVGEEIYAEFDQLKARTQNLDIAFSYPYLLHSPIGTFGTFNLYKNDSIFIDVNSEIGLLYQFGGFNRLKLFYKNQSSSVLNADTATIISSGELPDILDLTNNQYGVAIELQKLNYVLNPQRGFDFEAAALVGANKIKINQSIASLIAFDGDSIRNQYDSIDLKKINYTFNFSFSGYIPIKKRSTILLRNQSAFYIAKNILNNEKYRIGGYENLRGFNEEAIYTPFYSIFTAEYRFLLSKNSYFNAFADFALVEDERYGAGNIDTPIGFGLGIALETKGGIFSLSYALGKNLDNNIQFRNGKIHFGFVSIF